MIAEHLDKDNLHHAYLIEGSTEKILPEVMEFFEKIRIKTSGNADFSHITLDSFKIEDARNLRSFSLEKSVKGGKRIFLVSANSFLLEAQNTLLKMFEEPIPNIHFFLIVPDKNALLKTLVSRFYLISSKAGQEEGVKEAEKFISMPASARINFIKELLAEPEEDGEDAESANLNSARAKALKFLNTLESALHKKLVSRTVLDIRFFEHFFKVRKFLRMPGSSAKNLMESVALIVPNLSK